MEPFPYQARAAAVQQAQAQVKDARRSVQRRNDPSHPATRRWWAAVENFWAALRGALPPDFWPTFEALKQGDRRGLDLMIEFLEADPHCFRSGYLKADVIKLVRRGPLNAQQTDRLATVVLDILDKGDRREFRHYCRLARQLASPDLVAAIERRRDTDSPDVARRAGWMLAAIHRKS